MVPIMTPVRVWLVCLDRAGQAEVHHLDPAVSASSTFSGLTSRWTMPGLVGGAQRGEHRHHDCQRLTGGHLPRSRSTSRRVRPGTYSIER